MTVENISAAFARLRHVVYGLAAGLVVVSVGMTLLAVHVLDRQQLADNRTEKQRQAICAILANIPGQVPHEIKNARLVFARPGHPSDCQPLSKNRPTPGSAKAGSSSGAASPTVVVVPSGGGGVSASPRPASHPSPTSTPKPHPSGTPNPTPSPTCSSVHDVAAHPIRCLHL